MGGGGAVGFPALVDDDWLWGGKIDQIYQTIRYGIRNTNDKSRQGLMPRFGADDMLTSAQVGAVTDYVLSLSGRGQATPEGAKIFKEQCVACHGPDGKGNQEMGAPNLTDKVWLHGYGEEAILAMVNQGKTNQMPAQKDRLTDSQIHVLTAYVWGLSNK